MKPKATRKHKEPRRLKVGDRVRLRGDKTRKEAIVFYLFDGIEGGVKLTQPLGDFYSWYEADLERV
jgi:hypothetical protein